MAPPNIFRSMITLTNSFRSQSSKANASLEVGDRTRILAHGSFRRCAVISFLTVCLLLSLIGNGVNITKKCIHGGGSNVQLVNSQRNLTSNQTESEISDEDEEFERIWRLKPRPKPFKMPPSFLVHEATECALPRPVGACHVAPNERIHIVFISAQWNRDASTQEETKNIIKSVISQTRCKLWFHFMVAGDPETAIIPLMMDKMGAWNIVPIQGTDGNPVPENKRSPRGKTYGYVNESIPRDAALLYSLHDIFVSWVIERSTVLGLYPFEHHAGAPGMSKFFMADILWQVNRALYMDVDMLMAGDVQDLWNFTRQFDADEKLLYYMSNNHPEGLHPAWYLRPFCSCHLVLDLGRIRKANLTKMIGSKLMGQKIKSLDVYVEDGDQYLFTWICKQFKGSCRVLPWMWNVSGCSKPAPFLGLKSHGKRVNESCWRMVHFNCMAHKNGMNEKYPTPNGWEDAFQWVNGLDYNQFHQPGDSRTWRVGNTSKKHL